VLVEPCERLLERLVAVLGRDGLDRVAPGGGLTEEVFERGDLPFKLGDLLLQLGRLAVGELSLPPLRLPRAVVGSGCGRRVGVGSGGAGAACGCSSSPFRPSRKARTPLAASPMMLESLPRPPNNSSAMAPRMIQ